MTQPPLPPDKTDGYQVDVGAMRRDADSWQEAKKQISGALSAARGASLSTSDWSWIGGDIGLTEAYNAAHQRAVGLLEGATSNCGGMSDALDSAATAYEEQEIATTEKIQGIDGGD